MNPADDRHLFNDRQDFRFANSHRHRAAERLMMTNDLVAEIAEHVGYANPFAFSDAFKRWLGCHPSKYRHPRTKG